MEQLLDDISAAQDKRINIELAEQAKRKREREDFTTVMQSVQKQINDRKDRQIIAFETGIACSAVKLAVLEQIVNMFESKATIVAFLPYQKLEWFSNNFFHGYTYTKLSRIVNLPKGEHGEAYKFAIEYNSSPNRYFTRDQGIINGCEVGL